MKKQKIQNKNGGFFLCLLSLLMTLGGTSSAWADAKTLPYNYGFEDYNLATDGWSTANPSGLNSGEFGIAGSSSGAVRTGSYGFRFSSYSSKGDNTQYLISPEFNAPNGVNVSFYYKASSSSGSEKFKVGYSTTDTDVANFIWDEEISTNSTSWLEYENTFPAGTKYVAIYYYANYQYRLFVDDFNFTSVASGPALAVADGLTKISSGYSYNFGLTTAGATHYFTLSNPGTESITLNIAATNGFAVSNSSLTLEANNSSLLTVTMPDATASGTVTITPVEAVDPFTINVSGTVRDPNKVYLDFSDGQMPDGWSWVATGTYANSYPCSVHEGYISWAQYGGSGYAWAFTSPKLNFENGELIAFETAKYGESTYYNPSVTVEYTTDATGATGWTAIGSAFTDDTYGNWTKRSVNIPVDGVKYIRFNGWYIHMRNIYGGELPNEPKMVVTQPASLDYGVVDKGATVPTKTFTIANTGKATLEGISVTSGNTAFTISNAPTSLAAGASQEVTITMSTATAGALSSLITVSATDMVDATFTVTGQVLPSGLSVIDFNDNQLPARWENTGWTFSNGAAYAAYHNPAYVMTTPKIEMGDFLVVKGKIEYNSTSYYVTIKGLDVNDDEVYSKKLTNDVFNNEEYKYAILSDIPTTVKKLQFVGYYGYIDEIQGINYAPTLSVTTGDPSVDVTSPAAYDFGECAADATTTYHFTNTGAGTISITNVTITGDGAASYSTNWTTSKDAPFDLDITRTYNAAKAGTAQAAVVTVTTSEGDFVINVTGIDKAANAPELAVNPNVIDFGGTTVDVVTSVDVTNNGTGSMSVNIYSNNDDFTVSPASLTGIGAGETKSFNVTFKHGTPYGVKNGQIAVVPTYDTSAAVNINVTGKAKDPNAWSEDFTANTTPAGWEAGANWTIADGVAKGAYAYSSTTYLTTPTLKVNGTTDELTFDYQATSNYVNIKIQMSKDGAEFTDLNTISDLNNGNTGTYTITGLEAGNYQFRFKNDNYNLDNFEGFVLNMADHIMTITDNTIPTSGLKEGQSFEASVTVKEIRGVNEENVVAKLYMGTEVIGTSEATSVDANESKVISITCTPTTSGTNVEMYIEVTYAGGTLSTTTVKRNVAAITYLTLDETSSDAIVAGTYDNVTLKRKFTSGWNTVCLPFTISNVEAFFGAGAKAYNFSSYTDGNLGFTSVPTLTASYPYIVYVPTAITDDIELTDITIASGDATAFYRYQSGAYFRGTYAPVAAGEWTKTNTDDIIYGVVGATGRIQQAGTTASIKGFRAYFDLPASASAPSISFEDAATGIKTVITADELNQNGEVYNLNGQKVQNAHKGLYIVNGRKVVVNRK